MATSALFLNIFNMAPSSRILIKPPFLNFCLSNLKHLPNNIADLR